MPNPNEPYDPCKYCLKGDKHCKDCPEKQRKKRTKEFMSKFPVLDPKCIIAGKVR